MRLVAEVPVAQYGDVEVYVGITGMVYLQGESFVRGVEQNGDFALTEEEVDDLISALQLAIRGAA